MLIAAKLIISGICALVPTPDQKLVRVTCPVASHAHLASDKKTIIPAHYPYIFVKSSAVVRPDPNAPDSGDSKRRRPDFTWHAPVQDFDVYLLHSERMSVANAATMGTNTFDFTPVSDRTAEVGVASSLEYVADMKSIAPNSGRIKPEFLDVEHYPQNVGLRLDITGGHFFTELLYPQSIWEFRPKLGQKPVVQRLAQEIAVTIPTSGSTVRVELISYDSDFVKNHPQKTFIEVNDDPAVISMGDAPLEEIMLMETAESMHSPADRHFETYYRMVTDPPRTLSVPVRKSGTGEVRGGSGDCIPLLAQPQAGGN